MFKAFQKPVISYHETEKFRIFVDFLLKQELFPQFFITKEIKWHCFKTRMKSQKYYVKTFVKISKKKFGLLRKCCFSLQIINAVCFGICVKCAARIIRDPHKVVLYTRGSGIMFLLGIYERRTVAAAAVTHTRPNDSSLRKTIYCNSAVESRLLALVEMCCTYIRRAIRRIYTCAKVFLFLCSASRVLNRLIWVLGFDYLYIICNSRELSSKFGFWLCMPHGDKFLSLISPLCRRGK